MPDEVVVSSHLAYFSLAMRLYSDGVLPVSLKNTRSSCRLLESTSLAMTEISNGVARFFSIRITALRSLSWSAES